MGLLVMHGDIGQQVIVDTIYRQCVFIHFHYQFCKNNIHIWQFGNSPLG